MHKRDWLLMAIGSYIEPIQLQKTLFKFTRESSVPRLQQYFFRADNWGPCSREIYSDLEELHDEGLIDSVRTGQGWSAYRLTAEGEEQATQRRQVAPPQLVRDLDEIRAWVVERSFRQLLRDVYEQYPHFAKKSLFKE